MFEGDHCQAMCVYCGKIFDIFNLGDPETRPVCGDLGEEEGATGDGTWRRGLQQTV